VHEIACSLRNYHSYVAENKTKTKPKPMHQSVTYITPEQGSGQVLFDIAATIFWQKWW
jgi:hypothetical protein